MELYTERCTYSMKFTRWARKQRLRYAKSLRVRSRGAHVCVCARDFKELLCNWTKRGRDKVGKNLHEVRSPNCVVRSIVGPGWMGPNGPRNLIARWMEVGGEGWKVARPDVASSVF